MTHPKFVFVTGTSSGLGNALAHHLARENYMVFAGIRNSQDEKHLKHPHIIPVLCDVCKPEEISSAITMVKSKTNGAGLFALINNAGMNYISPFEYADESREKALLNVNLWGPVNLTRQFMPLLHEYTKSTKLKAKVINISSIGGIFGLPWEAMYHASKFALLGWSQSIRYELEALDIEVICFLPGGMKTRIFNKSKAAKANFQPTTNRISGYYFANIQHMYRTMSKFESTAAAPHKAANAIGKLLKKKNVPLKVYFGKDAFFIKLLTNLGLIHLLRHQFTVDKNI